MVGPSRFKFFLLYIVLLSVIAASGANAASNEWFTFKGGYLRSSYTQVYVEPEVQKVSWKFNSGSSISCSPVTTKNSVYDCTENGYVYCIDANDGTKNWEFPNNSVKDYVDDDGNRPWPNGAIDFQRARLTTPVTVFDNRVYLPYGQMLVVLNADSGKFLFRVDLSGPGHRANITTSPLVSKLHKVIIVGASNGWLYGFDIEGKEPQIRWRMPEPSGTGDQIESSPVLLGNNVYFGSNSRNFYCVELKIPASEKGLRAQDTPEVKWVTKLDGPVSSSPASTGSSVSTAKIIICSETGKMYAISAASGSVIWTYNAGGKIDGSPAISGNGRIVFASARKIICLDENGKLVWDTLTTKESISTPSIGKDYVYVTSLDGKVYVFSLSNGAQLSVKRTSTAIRSSPAIAYGKLFFGGDDGNIYSLEHGEDPPTLAVSKSNFSYQNVTPNSKIDSNDDLWVENVGGGDLDIEISSSRSWITVNPDKLTLQSGKSRTIQMMINTQGLSPGRYSAIIKVISNGGSVSITVDLNIVPVQDTIIVLTVDSINALVNGSFKKIDAKPYKLQSGTIMVPLRFVAESFECQVVWDQPTKTVTIIYNRRGITVYVTIGSKTAFIEYRRGGGKIPILMKDPPVIVGGKTFVPVQFMAQAFDARWVMISANQIKITIKGS